MVEERKGYQVTYKFNNDFVELMNKMKEKYGETVLSIHGISDKHLDITSFPKKFYNKSASSVASVSIDGNANVSAKDISQYNYERFKAPQKLNSIYLLYKWVKKLFSKKDAVKMVDMLISGEIFINDLTNVEMPYCYAFDLNNLLVNGMDFFSSSTMSIQPPKRAESFIAQTIQTTAFISNQIMGAVAYPSFFAILDKFYRAEYGEDYTKRLKEDNEMSRTIRNQFQNIIFSFNFPFRGNQSSFVNLSVLDKGFAKELFSGYIFADDGTSPNIDSFVELSKIFFEYFTSIQNKEGVFTFPVMTLAVSIDENTREYLDEEFVTWLSKANCEKSVGNIFQSKPTSFASCCRLKNDFSKLSDNEYANSYGVGGLNIGSHRVGGINLPRLAKTEMDNPNKLDEIVDILHKVLFAHRELIKSRIDAGVLPLYTNGWMSLTKQFSTIGLIGGNEYVRNKGLEITTEEGSNALLEVMKKIESKIEQYQKEETHLGNSYNIESIPGESMAIRLCELDKLLGYCDSKVKLYSNQYVSLMEKCSLYDRMKIQAKFDTVTSGGSIMHCTYKEAQPLTAEQYERIVRLAKDLGNEYFAINYAYCLCEDGHRTIGDKEVCDVCGKPIAEKFQRVVGFITKVASWNPVRRDYEYKNRTSQNINEEFKK